MHKITKTGIEINNKKSLLNEIKFDIKTHSANFLEIDILNVPVSIVNSIRRILMTEIPTMALENISLYNNTGVIVDEMLCHRLGLIPCFLNPDKYTEEDEVEYSLNVKNETKEVLNVLSDDFILESKINENEKNNFLKKNVLLTKLAPGQEIQLKAFATKNIGKEHTKWSPVSPAVYRYHPKIILKKDFYDEEAEKLKEYFSEGVIKLKNEKGRFKAFVVNERHEKMDRSILRNTQFSESVDLCYDSTHFIFTIETEVFDPLELFMKAVYLLNQKSQSLKDDITEFLEEDVSQSDDE